MMDDDGHSDGDGHNDDDGHSDGDGHSDDHGDDDELKDTAGDGLYCHVDGDGVVGYRVGIRKIMVYADADVAGGDDGDDECCS